MNTYKATNDYIFGRIFGQKKNIELLKDLIAAILPDIQIKKLEVNKQVSLERQRMKNKLGIMDILATLNNGIKVNIEVQVKDYKNTIERSLFYQAGVYHDSLQSGLDYIRIPETIGIWILGYDLFDEGPFHEIARLRRDYNNLILTDKYELHYIQLPKFKRKCKKISNSLEQWLTFFINDNLEEIRNMDNEYVKKAEEELEYLNGDEEERRLAELREKAIRDEAAAMDGAFTRGEEQGRRKGISEGRKEGIKEGIKEEKLQTAKKLLKKNMTIEQIIEITELTKEEIEKL